jgi:ABC-type sugar transport system ATPase subunit
MKRISFMFLVAFWLFLRATMDLLTVSNISKKKNAGFVLKQVSFTQQKFQKIAIAGETGSGKSTLLKIIAGLIQPDDGSVSLEGKRVLGPDEKLVPGHQAIAYLSQQYELRNAYRVEEILSYANMIPDEEAVTLYEICRITHLLKRRTDELSGGEKQRIALCRLLISSPKLLLLDEPYSNLDLIHTGILKSVVNDISERLALSCIMVSHSPVDTLSWADEIFIMKDGQFLQHGPPVDIYRQPVNEYAAGLFGKYNLLDAAVVGIEHNKKLFLRPEDVKIVDAGMKGSVVDVLFFGSYYEVLVSMGDDILTIRDLAGSYSKDETVFVAFGDKWFF